VFQVRDAMRDDNNGPAVVRQAAYLLHDDLSRPGSRPEVGVQFLREHQQARADVGREPGHQHQLPQQRGVNLLSCNGHTTTFGRPRAHDWLMRL